MGKQNIKDEGIKIITDFLDKHSKGYNLRIIDEGIGKKLYPYTHQGHRYVLSIWGWKTRHSDIIVDFDERLTIQEANVILLELHPALFREDELNKLLEI